MWILSALPGLTDTSAVGSPGPVLLATVTYRMSWLAWALLERLLSATLIHLCHWVWISHLVPTRLLLFCSVAQRSQAFLGFYFFLPVYSWWLQGWLQGCLSPSVACLGDKNGRITVLSRLRYDRSSGNWTFSSYPLEQTAFEMNMLRTVLAFWFFIFLTSLCWIESFGL